MGPGFAQLTSVLLGKSTRESTAKPPNTTHTKRSCDGVTSEAYTSPQPRPGKGHPTPSASSMPPCGQVFGFLIRIELVLRIHDAKGAMPRLPLHAMVKHVSPRNLKPMPSEYWGPFDWTSFRWGFLPYHFRDSLPPPPAVARACAMGTEGGRVGTLSGPNGFSKSAGSGMGCTAACWLGQGHPPPHSRQGRSLECPCSMIVGHICKENTLYIYTC